MNCCLTRFHFFAGEYQSALLYGTEILNLISRIGKGEERFPIHGNCCRLCCFNP